MAARPALFLFALMPFCTQAGGLDSAMQCVHGGMTSSVVPVTASVEQAATVALSRCADEIELAAISLAGGDRVDLSRIAVRRELHDYALAIGSGPVPLVAATSSSAPVASAF